VFIEPNREYADAVHGREVIEKFSEHFVTATHCRFRRRIRVYKYKDCVRARERGKERKKKKE
jgi:hypothetical protein